MSIGVIAASAPDAATTANYRDLVLADAPLAYYRLGETSGTVMVDSSGNVHDGQYFSGVAGNGATGLLTGDSDKCADFSNKICFTPFASWMTRANFSIEAIFVADVVSGNRTIASRYDGGGLLWTLRIDGSILTMWVNGSSLVSTTSVTTMVVGTKYHVAATYDGTNVRLYVNGTLERTVSVPGLSAVTPGFRIGTGTTGEYFDGRIDEVAYYGAALAGTRVAAHAAAV